MHLNPDPSTCPGQPEYPPQLHWDGSHPLSDGREGGRERGREGEREGEREGGREGGRKERGWIEGDG